mmetsp:Transcript_7494/g.9305  ORF Transcript_7494/g.9305 Transcript_7494/m.9305 type:complete len:107 (-) Transcript_7494:444-764(-)
MMPSSSCPRDVIIILTPCAAPGVCFFACHHRHHHQSSILLRARMNWDGLWDNLTRTEKEGGTISKKAMIHFILKETPSYIHFTLIIISSIHHPPSPQSVIAAALTE